MLIARVASARPVALLIAIACLALLGVLALALERDASSGSGSSARCPRDNEVRAGGARRERAGSRPASSPRPRSTSSRPGIAARRAQLGRLEDLLRREPGVAAVIGPTRAARRAARRRSSSRATAAPRGWR